MHSKKTPASELAKQTLTRLARDRHEPLPVNFCSTYRTVDGGNERWASFCRYTGLLEDALIELLGSWQTPGALLGPETALLARELSQLVPAASSEEHLKRVRDIGHNLGLRLEHDIAKGSELQNELLDAVRLVVSNLGKLSEEDHWLQTQLHATEALLNERISTDSISKAKDVLRAVLQRQQESQHFMADVQQNLKSVMADLIRHATSLVDDTAQYEGKIAELADHVQLANDISSIKLVVNELAAFVGNMGESVRHSHDGIAATQTRLIQAEQQIEDLRRNLAETSEKVRRDKLTGALNRSGLEEIWGREVQLAKNNGASLSLGILDVDNFKLLNDQYGHIVGDEALVHLTTVIHNTLYGTDTMARYGGEEFVILLPDTDVGGAKAVMKRLQRELTKHFFLQESNKLLITFSAGVTVIDLEADSLLSTIERADAALFKAKHLGKNRVVAA